MQMFVIIAHDDIRSLEIVVPFCYGIIDTIALLFWGALFPLSFHECV